MKERKHEAPPRYDAAFKEGAIRLVAEEGRPMREVAEELGVCTDTIRNWLKASGIQPKETERQKDSLKQAHHRIDELNTRFQWTLGACITIVGIIVGVCFK